MKGASRGRSRRRSRGGGLGRVGGVFLSVGRRNGRGCRSGARGSYAFYLTGEGLLAHLDPVILQLGFLHKVLHVSGPLREHINGGGRGRGSQTQHVLEWVFQIAQVPVTHFPNLSERRRAKRVCPFLGVSAHTLPLRSCALFQIRARLGLAIERGTVIVLPAYPIALPLEHARHRVGEYPAGRCCLPELFESAGYRVRNPLNGVAFERKFHLERAIPQGGPSRLDFLREHLQVVE
jgi:hypothetical protein